MSKGFPKGFLWGSATAAHQVEGGNTNQWTEWELKSSKKLAKNAPNLLARLKNWGEVRPLATNPDNYISGPLADHYNRYEEDFDMLHKMNMNAYRFSIEWSRIEPAEGVWDESAVDHYRRYIQELRRRDVEPMVTFLHFTLPIWFAKKGGFEKKSNIKFFIRFVEKVMTELGQGINYVITINEPEVYATFGYQLGFWPPALRSTFKWWRVVRNQMLAHKLASQTIHGINKKCQVSFAKNSCYFYPGDRSPLSRFSTVVLQYLQDDYFIKKAVKHCDFIGVNYYFSNRVCGLSIKNPGLLLNDLGWDLQPQDIQFVIERLHIKYKLPIIITENGIVDRSDKQRKWWIEQTLEAMKRSIANGADLRGYFHWSLMDNFEWAYGKWPRMGLVEVDYQTGIRKLRPSAIWFSKVIKSQT